MVITFPMRPLLTAALLLIFVPACSKKPALSGPPDPTPGFWIWHRSSDLSPIESTHLQRLGSPRLYRQIAEFGWRDGKWAPRPLSKEAPTLDGAVPVIRLDPGPAFLDHQDNAEALAMWLHYYFPAGVPSSLQLDYDCPARLLPRYADVLKKLKTTLALKEISATALATWIDAPGFKKLTGTVDELLPMFYDLTADPPADIAAGKCLPMAGPEAASWISRWKACPCPWRASLANFERLSLFEKDGSLVGHLRQWNPEDLFNSTSVQPIPAYSGGAAYRITRDASLQGTPVKKDQLLIWRAPADDALHQLISTAFSSGARGIVWFALPGPGLRTCHTPAHLAALERGETPQPTLNATIDPHGRVILRNDGPGDLTLSPGAPMHRLRLTADRPGAFADTGPGAFYQLSTGPSSGVPVSYSVKSSLSFTELQGDAEIASESGLIPSGEDRDLRWSLDDRAPLPLLRK
jgi:hypothetical protein